MSHESVTILFSDFIIQILQRDGREQKRRSETLLLFYLALSETEDKS